MKRRISKFIKKSWLHLCLWALSFYSIGSYFAISNFLKFIDFIYSAFFHIPLLILVYVNLKFLIPHFLQKQRHALYLILSLGNIALAYGIHELVFDGLLPLITFEFYMVSFTEASVLFSIFGIYSLVSTFLQLSISWYYLQEVAREKLSLELKTLKMQINPHFLFNSLNSIYALSLKKSEVAPRSILELSSLMRYMIYEVSEDKIALKKEIEALQHYIQLQKLRLDKSHDIQFHLSVDEDQQKIAPMLFLPLLENSFKHGLKAEEGNFVKLHLSLKSGNLHFELSNNKGRTEKAEPQEYGGIGLDNVQKRLDLIYGDRAILRFEDQDNLFQLDLKIKIHD